VQHTLASVPRVWPIEVWLEVGQQQAQRSLRLPLVFFEKSGEGLLFRCEVSALPWMVRKPAGLGVPFNIKRLWNYAQWLRSTLISWQTMHSGLRRQG